MSDSKQSDSRTVGFFDILGFRDLLDNYPLQKLSSNYDSAVNFSDALNKPLPMKNIGDKEHLFELHSDIDSWCHKYIFSDSIIIISKNDSQTSCLKLLVFALRLMQLFLIHKLPMRGAVTFGNIHLNLKNNLVLGRALTEAYELEKKQNWIGAVIDKSVLQKFPSIFGSSLGILSNVFPEYAVPFKCGHDILYRVINWRYNFKVQYGIESLFNEPTDRSAKAKIENTLKFSKTQLLTNQMYPSGKKVPIELERFSFGKNPEKPEEY